MKSIFYQEQIFDIIKHKHKKLLKMLFIKFCRDSQEFLGVKYRNKIPRNLFSYLIPLKIRKYGDQDL